MSRFHWLRWRGAILVFIASSSWPLHILAVNVIGIVRPERVIGLMAIAWLLGILLIAVLDKVGVPIGASENAAFVAVIFVMLGGAILEEFGSGIGTTILITCPILAGLVSARFENRMILNALVWGTAVAIATGPLIAFTDSQETGSGPSVVQERASLAADLTEKPDIFLIVFDGYPGMIATQKDGLGVGVVDVVSELRNRQFEVPSSSWSSYWVTMLSIPSLLDMSYPVTDENWRGIETRKQLQGVISGNSAFVDVLNEQGYQTHMVESGWSGASCTDAFDQCVPSPLIDEATYLILKRTIAWALLEDSPGPYVLGAKAGFEWLMVHGPDLSQSPEPDFVFMHVVSPHAPYLLSDDCSVDFNYDRAGTGFNIPGVSVERRTQYLVEQIDCMDRNMLEFADAVDPDDIVVYVSDHGTDRRYQANPDLIDWDRETIVERLNNFLAVRSPQGCSVGDEVIVPNVLRLVLGCISSTPIEPLPERMWVNPMVELDYNVVTDLTSMRVSPG